MNRKINPEHQKALEEVGSIRAEVEKFIFGARTLINNMLLGFFSLVPYDDGRKKRLGQAHALVMSPPGYGKTGSARILANTISGKYTFIAGHPEMKIAEILGFDMYHQSTGTFFFVRGPIFANIVVTDEINRIHPKAQAFNMQAMEERMVVVNSINIEQKRIDNIVHRLTPISDKPEDQDTLVYWNIATGNPFEQEGTYTIPEAQLDRFSIFFSINLPDREEEKRIRLENVYGDDKSRPEVKTVMDLSRALQIAHMTTKVRMSESKSEYMMRLIENSRPRGLYEDKDTGEIVYSKREFSDPELRQYIDDYVKAGLSPRSNFHFQAVAKTHAFMNGRDYVSADDIKYVARLIMIHRTLLKREARARNIKQYQVVEKILNGTEIPK